MNKIAEFYKGVALFSLLEDEELTEITSSLEEVFFKSGSVIFREGDPGEIMYIVREGLVTGKTVLENSIERHVADFGPGTFFGEMSIFERAARSATCVAVTDSLLLSIHEDQLFSLMRTRPGIAIRIMYRMLNIITERLNDRSEFLSEMVTWGEQARKRSITDELTDLYNRRFLDDLIRHYSERYGGSGDSISTLMIDIDHFADINEEFGREKGDRLLVEIVSHLKSCVGEKDFLARYGGDEFCLVLPGMEIEKAVTLSERIRKIVNSLDISPVVNKEGHVVTVSIGVASFPHNAPVVEELIPVSDSALYRAKSLGRNRVEYTV